MHLGIRTSTPSKVAREDAPDLVPVESSIYQGEAPEHVRDDDSPQMDIDYAVFDAFHLRQVQSLCFTIYLIFVPIINLKVSILFYQLFIIKLPILYVL